MSAKHEKSGQREHEPAATVQDTRSSSAAQPADPPEGADSMVDPELQAAREEVQATFARYQRLAADFENYKRRTRQELADRTHFANEELVAKLLPILDNFRRALDHAPQGVDRNWFEGIKLVARQFEDVLQAQGLSQIPAVGEKFDPVQHEAIAREETDEHEEGTVVEELQPGYRLHNRVLRPTLVKVAHPRALKS
ncbi:MAG TPA: nucleotide exchange factor GrpE [Candidatus Dormibacteraeota bacterium]